MPLNQSSTVKYIIHVGTLHIENTRAVKIANLEKFQ